MNMLLGFCLGVAGSLTAAALWATVGGRLLQFLSNAVFNLSGVWLAVFEPISPRQSTSIELVTISHARDSVRFDIENYNDVRGHILRLRGLGKYRSSQFSAVYYLVGRNEQDSGTFVLRSRSTDSGHTLLDGVYSQVFDRDGIDDIAVRTEPYSLIRINVPIRLRLRRLRRRTYFENFDEVRNWLESTGNWNDHAPTKGSRATSGFAPSAAREAAKP